MYSLEWPHVFNKPLAKAVFKRHPEDFHVIEYFNGEFSGQGEHLLLKIEKRSLTTEELIKSITKALNISLKCISYAGLKDRQSLATQWISIHDPGNKISHLEGLEGSNWRLIENTRHHKKLRPGFLAGNFFKIMLRDVSNLNDLILQIERIKETGVPNYFGEQRFGFEGNNLTKFEEMLVKGHGVKDRFLKGLYFSAARSWIFNQILARRVHNHSWNRALTGDVIQLRHSNSIFTIYEVDENIVRRIQEKDISPASPLAGKGKELPQAEALQLIHEIYQDWKPWVQELEKRQVEQSWRPNILHVEDVAFFSHNQNVQLSFRLPAGAFATTVLRELVSY